MGLWGCLIRDGRFGPSLSSLSIKVTFIEDISKPHRIHGALPVYTLKDADYCTEWLERKSWGLWLGMTGVP